MKLFLIPICILFALLILSAFEEADNTTPNDQSDPIALGNSSMD